MGKKVVINLDVFNDKNKKEIDKLNKRIDDLKNNDTGFAEFKDDTKNYSVGKNLDLNKITTSANFWDNIISDKEISLIPKNTKNNLLKEQNLPITSTEAILDIDARLKKVDSWEERIRKIENEVDNVKTKFIRFDSNLIIKEGDLLKRGNQFFDFIESMAYCACVWLIEINGVLCNILKKENIVVIKGDSVVYTNFNSKRPEVSLDNSVYIRLDYLSNESTWEITRLQIKIPSRNLSWNTKSGTDKTLVSFVEFPPIIFETKLNFGLGIPYSEKTKWIKK